MVLPPLFAIVNALSIAVCWSDDSVNTVVPSARLAVTLFVDLSPTGRSLRSRSVKVTEPESDSVAPSVIVPVTSTATVAGASLAPVIVTVTSSESLPPLPSVTVIVNTAVTVSSFARKLRTLSVIV